MSIVPTLVSGGIKLLGGLFGSRSARKAEERAAVAFRRSGLDNRIAAESGGYNPLTWLQATGGGAAANGGFVGAGGAAALASQELLMGGLQDLGSVLSGGAAQEAKERQLAYDMAKLEFDKASAVGGSSVAASGFRTAARAADNREFTQVTKYRGGSPPSRPEYTDEPRVRVFAPNGKPMFIPQGVAERLNINAGQNMMMGEYTELVGEIRGEGEGIVDLSLDLFGNGNVSENMTGGDFYSPAVPSRPEWKPTGLPPAKKNPEKFWTYFGHSFN